MLQQRFVFLDGNDSLNATIAKIGINETSMNGTGFMIKLVKDKLLVIVQEAHKRLSKTFDFKFQTKKQQYVITYKEGDIKSSRNGELMDGIASGEPGKKHFHSQVKDGYFSFLNTAYPKYSEYGKFSSFKVWNKKLSQKEVQADYNKRKLSTLVTSYLSKS